MIVPDVNVLVAAYRADHVHHAPARSLLLTRLAEDTVLVPDLIWAGLLRVVTNRRVFAVPSTIEEAAAFVRAVVGSPGCRPIAGLPDGIESLLRLLHVSGARANLVPDAYIAAVAMAHGCAVATFDHDFRRFDGLRIVLPS